MKSISQLVRFNAYVKVSWGEITNFFSVQFDEWANKSFDMLFKDSASIFGFGTKLL